MDSYNAKPFVLGGYLGTYLITCIVSTNRYVPAYLRVLP